MIKKIGLNYKGYINFCSIDNKILLPESLACPEELNDILCASAIYRIICTLTDNSLN